MELLANPEARKVIEAYRAGKTRFHPLSALDVMVRPEAR
jgi:hypothetical protein